MPAILAHCVRLLERARSGALVAAVVVACLASAHPRQTLAAAAGLILEAVPFAALAALLAALARRRGGGFAPALASWLSAVSGCGCGRSPGALALPVAGLTALTFGPAVAIARFAAACVVARPWRGEWDAASLEPLDAVAALAPYAVLGGIATEAVRSVDPVLLASPVVALAAGAAVGALTPCTLGAVAIAASLRAAAPWCAAGILAVAGIGAGPGAGSASLQYDRRAAHAANAVLAIVLAACGGGGLVHPRLAWPIAAAAVALFVRALVAGHGSASLVAPALVAASLVLGAPAPRFAPDRTTLDGAFPGAPVRFTGVVERRAGAWLVVRFVMTCCRADLTPVAIVLDREPALAVGSWAMVDGTFVRGATGPIVRVQHIVAVGPPRDPFLYR